MSHPWPSASIPDGKPQSVLATDGLNQKSRPYCGTASCVVKAELFLFGRSFGWLSLILLLALTLALSLLLGRSVRPFLALALALFFILAECQRGRAEGNGETERNRHELLHRVVCLLKAVNRGGYRLLPFGHGNMKRT